MLGKRSRGKTSKNCIKKTGDILGGNLNMDNNLIKNLGDPVDAGDAVNRKYINTSFVTKISRSTTNDGDVDMNNFRVAHLANLINPSDAATKDYADTKLPTTGGTIKGNLIIDAGIRVSGPPDNEYSVPNKSYIDPNFLIVNGGAVNGNLDMQNNSIRIVNDPVNPTDGVNLGYLNNVSYGNVAKIIFNGIIDSAQSTNVYGTNYQGKWKATSGFINLPTRFLFVISTMNAALDGSLRILIPLPPAGTNASDSLQLFGSYIIDSNNRLAEGSPIISGQDLFDKTITVTVYIAIY